jgi:predicted membrane channel-forming protein YqfA (hemolysin III family)
VINLTVKEYLRSTDHIGIFLLIAVAGREDVECQP